MLAAKAGATFVSPFIGRLDDIGMEGMSLIEDMRVIFDNYMFNTQILAASIRTSEHVLRCAKAGADVGTMPAKIMKDLIKHPLTDNGLQAFLNDWSKTGQKI